MKRTAKKESPKGKVKVMLGTGTVEDFFERSRERARKLDRGEKLTPEIRMAFEDPADLLRVLSAERVRVLKAVRVRPTPVSGLALLLKRDRTAVRRDVNILVSYGLVRTREQLNPGHGRMKIVEPLAEKYQLSATI
jgi:predicted transcriptional regulator